MKKKMTFPAAAIAVLSLINQAGAQNLYNNCASHIAYGTQKYGGRVITFDTIGIIAKAGGKNVTWDYSNLVTTSIQNGDTTCYIAPATAPGGRMFPGANICSYTCNSSYANENRTYTFGGGNADSMYTLGSFAVTVPTTGASIDTIINVYKPPMVSQLCPFAYGDSFTNTYSNVEYVRDTVSKKRQCTSTTRYAGYGTLILPTGTYPNVSFIHFTKNEVDSAVTGGGTYNVMLMRFNTFIWGDSTGNSLFIFFGEITAGTLVINLKSVWYVGSSSGAQTKTVSANTPYNNNTTTIYSNSMMGEFVLNTRGGSAKSIDVFNMQGKRVYESASNGRAEKIKIDAPNGIYFIRLKTEHGVLHNKLIIDR